MIKIVNNDPDRLPGEVVLPDDYNDYGYDPTPKIYDINMDYDKLFDPYEELEKDKQKDEEEDTMIIPSNVILEANRQEPESFYENDESYDTLDSYYATHNRKRRHKSLQHFVKKTMTDSSKDDSGVSPSPSTNPSSSSNPKLSIISDITTKAKRVKHKARRRLDKYFGGLAVT